MKKYLVSAATILLFSCLGLNSVFAQEGDEKEKLKDKISEHDEIIIKQKDAGKDGTVTVVIKDGRVTVNGKPIEEFDDSNISVRKNKAIRLRAMAATSPFRGQNNVWGFEGGEEKAFLGVTTEASEGGAKVIAISENTAAAKAGLKKGDVITRVDNKAISNPETLSEAIAASKPDEKVTITYKRDNKENKASVTLGKRTVTGFGNVMIPSAPGMPEMERFNFDFDTNGGTTIYSRKPRIGIRAQDTEEGKGVKVLGVDENSAAEKAGLKVNDIITEFEGKSVNSADELAAASRDAKDKQSMKMKINRNGSSQTLEVKIPKKLKTANL